MQDIDVNAWMGASLAAQTCWLRHNHHGCSKLIWPQKYSDQNSVLMFHAHDAFYYICFSSKHMLELWSVPLQSANEVCPSVPSGFLSWCQSCSWYMGRQLTEILILQHRLKNQWLKVSVQEPSLAQSFSWMGDKSGSCCLKIHLPMQLIVTFNRTWDRNSPLACMYIMLCMASGFSAPLSTLHTWLYLCSYRMVGTWLSIPMESPLPT